LRHNSAGANHVEGNLIVHNSHGVNIGNGAFNQVIGGTDAGAGNTIAFNGVGVVLSRSVGTIPPHPSYPYAKQNRIVGNSIHDNTALGIDLSDGGGNEADGVTPNDPLDTDTGSNEFQNFPVLIAASSGASPHVRGALNSTPNSTFVLDFYASSAADPSGYGEGERYLGAATVVTDAVGNATFNVSLSSALQFGEYVTATATDSAGNTSEFSAAVLASVLEVQIDVKPGDTSNTVNVDSNGVIAVAILTTAEFDAALVNAGSVIFAGAQAVQSALEDVNGDGRLDLLLHFRTQDTSLRSIYEQLLADDMNGDGVLDSNHQAATVTLTGETVDHAFIEGVDTLDLFLSGKALRSFLDALAAAGAI
jgi:parallel beta-helix repeat protein